MIDILAFALGGWGFLHAAGLVQDGAGWTALHWAQNVACAELLLKAGASEAVANKKGETCALPAHPALQATKRANEFAVERLQQLFLYCSLLPPWDDHGIGRAEKRACKVAAGRVATAEQVALADFLTTRREKNNKTKKLWEE